MLSMVQRLMHCWSSGRFSDRNVLSCKQFSVQNTTVIIHFCVVKALIWQFNVFLYRYQYCFFLLFFLKESALGCQTYICMSIFFFINFYIFNKNMYFNENEHFSKNCSRVTSKDLHAHMYIDKNGISLKTYLT